MTRIAILLPLALAFGGPGDADAGRFFPIGMYGVDDPAAVAVLRDAGFNAIQTYRRDPAAIEPLAAAAGRAGMRLLAFPQELTKAGSDAGGFPAAAWYLTDEPDVRNEDPADIRALNERTKAWAPGTPTALVIGEGRPAAKYGGITDVMMLDWYPVPHLPLDSVADELDLVRKGVPEDQPVWMVLQAFNWRDYRQRDPAKPRIGRFPTRAEIRFMSYLAIVHGASGLFYFQLDKPGKGRLLDFPDEWRALSSVAGEIASLRPVLEGGQGETMAFSRTRLGMEGMRWAHGGSEYAVILNRLRANVVEMPEHLLEAGWRALFEEDPRPRAHLLETGGRRYLGPYSVVVLRKGDGSSR